MSNLKQLKLNKQLFLWLIGFVVLAMLLIGVSRAAGDQAAYEVEDAQRSRLVDLVEGTETDASGDYVVFRGENTTDPDQPDPDPDPNPNPGPGTVNFSDDFVDPNWGSRYDFEVFHRDWGIEPDQTWLGDHQSTGPNDICNAPTNKRVINLGSKIANDGYYPEDFNDEWIYRCVPGGDLAKAHIMTSIGPVNGYSIGAFTPKQTFTDVNEVRWDVNQTDLGDRQWTEVAIVPAGVFNFFNLPCQDGLPCATDGHDVLGSVGTQWGAQRARMIITHDQPGGFTEANSQWGYRPTPDGTYATARRFGEAYGANDPALTSIAIRLPNFFRDNGNGTLTWGFKPSNEDWQELTVPGSFPNGPVRVVFKDHSYTPLKSPATLLPETTFTWHWDNISITVE